MPSSRQNTITCSSSLPSKQVIAGHEYSIIIHINPAHPVASRIHLDCFFAHHTFARNWSSTTWKAACRGHTKHSVNKLNYPHHGGHRHRENIITTLFSLLLKSLANDISGLYAKMPPKATPYVRCCMLHKLEHCTRKCTWSRIGGKFYHGTKVFPVENKPLLAGGY